MKVVLIYASGDATVKHMMLWKDDGVVWTTKLKTHTDKQKADTYSAYTKILYKDGGYSHQRSCSA